MPEKVHTIVARLPAWIGSDAEKERKATTLMHQLDARLKAHNFEEAEKTADTILKMMGASVQAPTEDKPK